jgi:putative MATE family efflux protein
MRDLTKGNVFKLILVFTLPILFGSFFGQANMIIDSIIVGKNVGTQALAAIGEVFPFIFIMVSIVTGISIGANILLAQFYGAKDMVMVKKVIETNIIFLFFASIIVTFSGILLCPIIFELMDIPPDVMPYAVIYTRIYFAGMTFMFFTNTIQAMLRSLGDSKTPFYFVVATNLLNIAFDLIFVLWLKWGIYGISFAVILSYIIVFIGLMYYMFYYQKHIKISLFKLKFDKELFFKSFRTGLPIGVQTLVLSLAMSSAFSIVNKFGTNAVAAYTVGSRIDAIMFMFAMDITMGFSSFVGQNLGAGRYDRVKKGMLSAWIICFIPIIILTVFSLFEGEMVIGFFSNDKLVIELGKQYLYIVSGFYIVCTTTFIFGSVFNGAGRTVLVLISTIIGWWIVRIPVSYYLSQSIGVEGVWWSISAQWAAELIFALVLFRIGKWKDKVVIQTLQYD